MLVIKNGLDSRQKLSHNFNLIMHDEFPARPTSRAYPVFPQLHGVVALNKPSGPSSAQCLKIFKRLGQKKIGHAGTLDPMASGVLLALLGNATKLSSWLQAEGCKVYTGVLRLGIETDTWDKMGQTVAIKNCFHISEEEIRREIAAWTARTDQEVPPYSAAKHEGRPMYKLARVGGELPRRFKSAHIIEADMLEFGMPFVRFRVKCGSGVYIRSLAHSLGKRLGVGAILWELKREYSHPFGMADSWPWEDVAKDPAQLPEKIHSLASALPDWPRIRLTSSQAAAVKNGRPLATMNASGHALLCHGGEAIALAQANGDGVAWQVLRGLWT